MAIVVVGAAPVRFTHAAVAHGKVRQLDFLPGGWTQILLTTDPAVLITTNANVQSVLEASVSLGVDVDLLYQQSNPPIEADEVKLSVRPTAGSTYVTEVSCTKAGLCTITTTGNPARLTTNNPLALGVALTALVRNRPLAYVTTDSNGRITRVQVTTIP